jgi:hypothetical protein
MNDILSDNSGVENAKNGDVICIPLSRLKKATQKLYQTPAFDLARALHLTAEEVYLTQRAEFLRTRRFERSGEIAAALSDAEKALGETLRSSENSQAFRLKEFKDSVSRRRMLLKESDRFRALF